MPQPKENRRQAVFYLRLDGCEQGNVIIIPNMPNETELSEREREILRLAATGASNKEIAQELFISTNTVKVHLRNVFAKIGVASRTEATLYAIREGIAPPPIGMPISTPVELAALTGSVPGEGATTIVEAPRPQPSRLAVALLSVLVLLAAVLLGFTLLRPRPSAVTAAITPQPTLNRWSELAPLPEGRAGLAGAVYENQVYAIAGETANGVSGAVTSYDPAANLWTERTSKPMPVADIGAALLGEKIYVPGGRLASGAMTDVLEVYDPRRDSWETRAPLPIALSAYSLASYEGRLYLFGGTDGQQVLDTVYEYDPASDAWRQRTPMPLARSFSGAAAAGGKIYVIGGWDGQKALAVNEVYYPQRDGTGENPWEEKASLPEGRFGMGVAGLGESIYLLGGGKDNQGHSLANLIFFLAADQWEIFNNIKDTNPTRSCVILLNDRFVRMGGTTGTKLIIGDVNSYQAFYTIAIPGVIR